MTQATDEIKPIRLHHIEVSYFLDPAGTVRITTHFENEMEDKKPNDHSDMITHLGMLDVARYVLLGMGFEGK